MLIFRILQESLKKPVKTAKVGFFTGRMPFLRANQKYQSTEIQYN